MESLAPFAVGGLAILFMMFILWMVSLRIRNASIVDIFWGAGFVISAWIYYLLTPDGLLERKLLISCLATIWGLRLTLHVLKRNWKKPEDFRYQKWRDEHGTSWWWKSLFQVFLLQGILMWVISTPLLVAQIKSQSAHLTALDFLAVSVWMVGFFFEVVGDMQLTRFKTNPENAGKVLSTGVWRFSRHPNYFGDATQWWAYYLLAVSAGGWWTIFSPLIMTLFLLKVSGVALLEKTLKNTKPRYKEYMESTSAFIPWFPAKQRKSGDKHEDL